MKYILLTADLTVAEIIPEYNPIFPDVAIGDRYTPDFVAQLLEVEDSVTVEQNWLYDPLINVFLEPEKEVETEMENINAVYEGEDVEK